MEVGAAAGAVVGLADPVVAEAGSAEAEAGVAAQVETGAVSRRARRGRRLRGADPVGVAAAGGEGGENLRADLEAAGADGGAEERVEFRRRGAGRPCHGADGAGGDVPGGAAPAGVDGGRRSRERVVEQQRDAVGGLDRDRLAGAEGEEPVALRFTGLPVFAVRGRRRREDDDAVDLAHRLESRRAEGLAEAAERRPGVLPITERRFPGLVLRRRAAGEGVGGGEVRADQCPEAGERGGTGFRGRVARGFRGLRVPPFDSRKLRQPRLAGRGRRAGSGKTPPDEAAASGLAVSGRGGSGASRRRPRWGGVPPVRR